MGSVFFACCGCAALQSWGSSLPCGSLLRRPPAHVALPHPTTLPPLRHLNAATHQNKPLVQRVLLVVAHGLDSTTWSQAGAAGALPAWRRLLGEPVELQARNATLAPGAG